MPIYIGIDPGASGAIVGMNEKGQEVFIQEFTTPVDMAMKMAIFHTENKLYFYHKIAIEQVSPAPIMRKDPKTKRTTPFYVPAMKLQRNIGIWMGILAFLDYEIKPKDEKEYIGKELVEISPKTWRKGLIKGVQPKGQKELKIAYTELAEKEFPDVKFRTPRGRILDGVADAWWIANYLRLSDPNLKHYGKNNNIIRKR